MFFAGQPMRWNFTAIGDAVNYAARLETNAEPGEVVVGSSTYQLIRHLAQVIALDHLERVEAAKGKQELFGAYLLIGLRNVTERERPGSGGRRRRVGPDPVSL